ncbi:MAG: ankyrin repeat domain-containing protein [Candidatus Omnitrophica bacterium]|nr:ankyrin repeat domain-containing protein [Candidatus Omnitrophota bacterium]
MTMKVTNSEKTCRCGRLALALPIMIGLTLLGCEGGDLFLAAAKGKTTVLQNALDADPGKLYARDSMGRTLLHRAAEGGAIETVRFLLDRGAETDTPDRVGWTPLDYARLNGSEEIVGLLEAMISLPEAISRSEIELVHRILSEDPEAVNHPTPEGAVPLHFAVDIADATLVGILIQAGGDPNASYADGESPLEKAIAQGNRRIVQVLLEAGANPDFVDPRHRTPVYVAIQREDSETVRLLLENGANPNLELAEGLTPIQIAAQKGATDIVTELLRRGAVLEATNRDGRDSLYWAKKHGHFTLAHFIEEEIRIDDD